MVDQGLLTLDEAAAYLGVAKITLRRWTRKGELPCVRIGKRGDRRFRQADLDEYVRRNSTRTTGKTAPKTGRSAKRNKRGA